MKLSLLFVAAFSSLALADFHLMDADARQGFGGSQTSSFGFQLIDSNKFDDCSTILNQPIESGIMDDDDKTSYRKSDAGVCSSGALNFYYIGDSDSYDYYYDGGDGTKIGSCYRNNSGASHNCISFFATVR
jgi:hypothetical protein